MSVPEEAIAAGLAAEEARLAEKLGPGWKADVREIRNYAESIGLTPDEINGLYDHRAVLALRDGAMAAKSKREADAEVEKTERVEREHLAADKARFKETGSARDAGKIFSRHLRK